MLGNGIRKVLFTLSIIKKLPSWAWEYKLFTCSTYAISTILDPSKACLYGNVIPNKLSLNVSSTPLSYSNSKIA